MKQIRLLFAIAALAVACTISSCTKEETPDVNVVTQIVNDPSLSLLTRAVTKAGLADALRNAKNITIFAPTDEAFGRAGISAATIDAMDAKALGDILRYHVITSEIRSGQLRNGSSEAPTLLSGNNLFVTQWNGAVTVNGRARVVNANIAGDNGTIHKINNVVMPPSQTLLAMAQANSNLSLLVQAVVKCNLQSALSGSPLTILAPSNDAFIAAGFNSTVINNASGATLNTLRDVLTYHVIPRRGFSADFPGTSMVATALAGRSVQITSGVGFRGTAPNQSNAAAITSDLKATNGVMHIINRVLLP